MPAMRHGSDHDAQGNRRRLVRARVSAEARLVRVSAVPAVGDFRSASRDAELISPIRISVPLIGIKISVPLIGIKISVPLIGATAKTLDPGLAAC